jgi:hypothetical protein
MNPSATGLNQVPGLNLLEASLNHSPVESISTSIGLNLSATVLNQFSGLNQSATGLNQFTSLNLSATGLSQFTSLNLTATDLNQLASVATHQYGSEPIHWSESISSWPEPSSIS